VLLFRTELEAAVYTTHFRSGSSVTRTHTHTSTITHRQQSLLRFSTRGSPGGFTGARDKAPTTRLKVGTQFNTLCVWKLFFDPHKRFFLRMGKRQQLRELWVMFVQDVKCLHFVHYDTVMSLLVFEIV